MRKKISKKLRKEMKKEAMRRLEILNLPKTIEKEFKKFNTINKSEYTDYISWLNDEEIGIIEDIEFENECIIYHIIESEDKKKIINNFLYISSDKESWERIYNSMKNGITTAFVGGMNTELSFECIKFETGLNLRRKFN